MASCYDDPTVDACEDFEIPADNATLAVTNLCRAMDWMPGCRVAEVCRNDRNLNATAKFCRPVAVLSDICAFDMPRMRGCATYQKVCKPGTKVKQCSRDLPLPYIPTTSETLSLVRSICDEMDHTGCEQCVAGSGKPCDAFTVYANLCLVMPSMGQCSRFHNLCSSTPNFPLCSPTGGHRLAPPAMKMFFHAGYSDYLLFEPLVPRTFLQYALALVSLFALALAYEYLIKLQRTMEAKWAALAKDAARQQKLLLDHDGVTSGPSNGTGATRALGPSVLVVPNGVLADATGAWAGSTAYLRDSVPAGAPPSQASETAPLLGGTLASARKRLSGPYASWLPDLSVPVRWNAQRVRLARAAFRLVGVSVAYSLMLLVMTFNVGYFVVVVVGLTLGTYWFGPDPYATAAAAATSATAYPASGGSEDGSGGKVVRAISPAGDAEPGVTVEEPALECCG
ncbi:hypothetical protein HDU96_003285 [Phlyctochytrium bullatum]|nr:hypothetical protein HDU96_003285 [Phlyctochytrium bullatum]